MKMRSAFTALLLLQAGTAGAGPKPAPCASQHHRQFDFWIGTWSVTDRGNPAGRNEIQRILGGCALLENWSGAQGGTGKSLNFFDGADGMWHQTWIDGSGAALFLAGKFENGTMRLTGQRPATAQQPAQRHRITWTPQPGGNVRQLWETAPADKDEWTVQFDGTYVPVGNPAAKPAG